MAQEQAINLALEYVTLFVSFSLVLPQSKAYLSFSNHSNSNSSVPRSIPLGFNLISSLQCPPPPSLHDILKPNPYLSVFPTQLSDQILRCPQSFHFCRCNSMLRTLHHNSHILKEAGTDLESELLVAPYFGVGRGSLAAHAREMELLFLSYS